MTTETRHRHTFEPSNWIATLWFGLGLFTIGYTKVNIIQAFLCIFAWPYYMGTHLAP